ncbi:lipopolysaccharide biosynthesis protein [Enterococcus faecalis]|uniref:lipopolysaccharide biosynthesis protein n=1 Tax=Enterococcus faecalis TaxID=1351 RepID=UPI0025B0AC14|nr:oligosaccharide flippase family protein [Enterococcus faecalis]MDN3185221.1 oligosaccharide flippase family protein [Enterococcus faecalis]
MKKNRNRYKHLLTNTIVFGIGNIGTKLIGILLLPFYTSILTTAEYGIADIYTNTINLMLPIVSFSIYDAVLRYTLDEIEHKEKILANGFKITLLGNSLVPLVAVLLKVTVLKNMEVTYLVCICIIISVQSFQLLLSNYVRGMNKSKIYALSGIINAISTSAFSYIFMYFIKLHLIGYLLSIIIGNLSTIIFLCFFIDLKKMTKIRSHRIDLASLLQYSLPLIPNAILWWGLSSSSRFIILFFKGAEANGIFSVANKIPSIVTSVAAIFIQAWQLTAIKEYQKKDTKAYYNSVYNIYYSIMCFCVFGMIVFLRPVVSILLDFNYYQSWVYSGPLLIGSLFLSLSSFLGTHYLVVRQTKNIFTTSLVAGIINLVISLITVPTIGIAGAVLGICMSYIFLFLLRIREVENMSTLGLNSLGLLLMLPVFAIQLILITIYDNGFYWYAANSLLAIYCSTLFYFIYKREVKL